MRRTIIATLTAASSALLFACTSTPEAPLAGADPQQPTATAPGAQPQLQTLGRNPTASGDAMPGKNDMLAKRSIYYDYGKFEIKDEYRGIVEAHAKYLRDNPGMKVLIEGNADERGSREFNVGLGQRRSDTLKQALLLFGAKESQMESVSLGEEKPLCTDHAEDCWWKNRRGDIQYTGKY